MVSKMGSTIRWISIMADAKLAKSTDGALVTDVAYLDAFITVEEATAGLLSHIEALPDSKSCQTRLEHELNTVYV